MTLIAPKMCGYCAEPFTPTKPHSKFCSNRCKARFIGRRLKGVKPLAACAAKERKRVARFARMTQERFGPLTARERALLQFGLTAGYRNGYNQGYAQMARRAGKRAA